MRSKYNDEAAQRSMAYVWPVPSWLSTRTPAATCARTPATSPAAASRHIGRLTGPSGTGAAATTGAAAGATRDTAGDAANEGVGAAIVGGMRDGDGAIVGVAADGVMGTATFTTARCCGNGHGAGDATVADVEVVERDGVVTGAATD